MKTKNLIVLSLASILILGCTSHENQPKSIDLTGCYQEGVLAPTWTCVPEVKDHYSSVGISEKSDAGMSFMRRVSLANGRSEISQQIQSKVKDRISVYTGTTGSTNNETVDKVVETITKQVAQVNLTNSKSIDQWTSPLGTLYMLVTVDHKNANTQIRNNLKTSFKNDDALWQQFKAKNALEELEKDFSN